MGCGIDEHYNLRCWGPQYFDQTSAWAPKVPGDAPIVNVGTNRKVIDFGMTVGSVCALLDNMQVKCFGENSWGRLGNGTLWTGIGDAPGETGDNLPYLDLGTVSRPIQIVGGSIHYCALFENGRVKCWGHPDVNGLEGLHTGHIPGTMGDNLPFVNMGTGRTVKWLSSSTHHTCALRDNNTFVCWGYGDNGKLGRGDSIRIGAWSGTMGDNLVAVDLNGQIPLKAGLGESSTCVVLQNGQAKCWGANNFGQLGQGDVNSRGDQPNELGANLLPIDLQW